MNAPSSAELRAVDVEAMREWYREQVERGSIRQVAKLCGIGHSSLHNFLSGASPHPRIRSVLARYYLSQGNDPDHAKPALDALMLLPPGIEGQERQRLHGVIMGVIEQAYRARGDEPARWIAQMQAD